MQANPTTDYLRDLTYKPGSVIDSHLSRRTVADTLQPPKRKQPGQMLIEGAGELRLHFIGGNALGVQHPVFQGNISDFQRGEQMLIGYHVLHPLCRYLDFIHSFHYIAWFMGRERADSCRL